MIKQVLAGRTLSVSVDANSMGNYRSGVFRSCPANYNVNHAVNIVGVNVTGGYWIIRNSWGDWWGDNGYMKIAMVSYAVAQLTCPLPDTMSSLSWSKCIIGSLVLNSLLPLLTEYH